MSTTWVLNGFTFLNDNNIIVLSSKITKHWGLFFNILLMGDNAHQSWEGGGEGVHVVNVLLKPYQVQKSKFNPCKLLWT